MPLTEVLPMSSLATAPLIEARDVRKTYRKASVALNVLRGVDLCVYEGEMISIVGQSGSGKSTLLHLLGTLDAPDEGQILYRGQRVDNAPRSARDRLRNAELGMIFQAYHLLPELTALENVLAPAMVRHGVFAYWSRRQALRARATELLERVGLGSRMLHKPRELSGGEMQRTAIARALMNEPRLLLADEPTGNLDRSTGEGVIELLRGLNLDDGLTVVMVTHDAAIAAAADRQVTLVEGRVETTGTPDRRRQA
ncbi:ABC transporter ATP-binding protein [Botrimarina hoheduenensis]|uniref:P-loop containing nucleoside triphosphate hydrolase n=1 Tax=Botrimarina hoheduenensis TaxID=2528000 RepID=A0A5C5WEH4_9BACT|nr:ABC transporter ATP-binding protein [Botrimarina hoheduenensis]TWT48471.1 P-loop containing nucleoside triphosphate hydrolase [Botrimarina hoheduenensis]